MQNRKAAFLLFSLLFLLASLAGAMPASGADAFTIAAPPSWVMVEPNLGTATNSTGENIRYILLDDQVNATREERYHRIVEEPVNASGVQDCVQISIDYDPSYEHLTIHDIAIHRGTNILNCLDPAKIKVIQQEKDLDMNVYNGEVSAVLFLEDVQIGDQIDYSYTITGSNPIFAGHYLGSFEAQWADTVTDERFRLLWPSNRFLGIKNHGTDIQPRISQSGNLREYVWRLHNIPAINEEDSLPSWYDPYPWVQFSEFASWQEVGRWALQLYPRPERLDPKLMGKISDWEKRYPDPEGRMAAALAFVQDEIRYMGIEVGPNSHQPNDPSVVFARRFGDCKDKAYLFCTLLSAMKIEASEALVNTENAGTTAGWLPSPYAFNHVVAQVRLHGQTYWLDPTELHQGGAIDDHFFPDYGCCLLVRSDTTNLTFIPQQRTGWSMTTIHETFTIHGRHDPADFTVRTLAHGVDADQLRENFADKGRDKLQKDYLNYYAREYPKIRISRPMEVIDHRDENVFETIEHYRIDEFWTLSDDKQNFEGDFYPQTIRDAFDEPNTTLRSMPLQITYPIHDTLETEVFLPESWPLTNDTEHFQSSATELDFSRRVRDNWFEMDYDYQTLTNVVFPNKMPDYISALGQMKNALGYSLTWTKEDDTSASSPAGTPDKGGINWTVALLGGIYAILLLMISAVIITVAALKSKTGQPPPLLDEDQRRLRGLGGWLILVAIGLIITPLRVSAWIISNAHVFAPATWHNLTDPSGAAYNGLWAPLLISELCVNLTTVIFALLLLVLFFQRRRLFPVLLIVYLVSNAIMITVDHFATGMIPAAASHSSTYDPEITRTFFGCFIWIPYTLVSKRVKATFTR